MKFNLKKYKKNEDANLHTENTLQLCMMFGTPEEIKEMQEIKRNHINRGHILHEELIRRNELNRKYYKLLK